MKPKAVVFDLDGVLVDCSRRYELCIQEAGGKRDRVFWECILSEKYMDLDQPNTETIETLKEYYRRGYMTIIPTGRIKEKRKENKGITEAIEHTLSQDDTQNKKGLKRKLQVILLQNSLDDGTCAG